jgi:spore cortex biosynthesis protein YabQ
MIISTDNQAYIFLATVYSGMLLGLVYDIYRAFRMIIRPKRWFIAILDLCFWIFGALLSFFMLFRVNGGEVRLYAFFGLALGWGLYILIVGSLVVKLLVRVYEIISAIVLWPIKMVTKGVKWVAKKWPGNKKIENNKISTN